MTNYIATVKIKIDPQAHIDAKYEEYKKSLEKGKSATEAGLSPPTEAEMKLYVRKVVLDRLSPDNEIRSVSVEAVSAEDEGGTNKNPNGQYGGRV
jgi:hypothetical protein